MTLIDEREFERLPPPGDDEPAEPSGPPSRGAGRRNIVAEIADRRRADIRDEMGRLTLDDHLALAAATLPPRPILDRLASPGLHLIAEIKRSSPSAGAIAGVDEDIVARARAYEAGGATAISVLCEPHWFGGSVDDLRAVRAAVAIPVLAKEFVVEPIQLPHLRAAGADIVLLLAVLHPAKRLSKLVDRALEIGLEPLVEAHDQRELERALATNARLIGINNRDLRTLEVDTDRAIRLRTLVPDDRLVVAESGVRDAATIAAWRAVGFDAALVGETLIRSADPAAAARAFVTAGRPPADPANTATVPFVKICGVTDADGILAAVRAGADAIGLNLVPGTPRALDLAEAVALARVARSLATSPVRIVAVTADAGRERIAAIVTELDPDAVQFSGDETADDLAAAGRPAWKALRLRAGDDPAQVVERARAFLAAGAERIFLDAAGGPHPGGTGTRVDPALAAAVAREVPVVLAGGLAPANVADALRAIPAIGVDTASGVERPRVEGQRPTKDPLRVAIFAKRARAAR
ncbi:MAG TPA: bifunctional indole-3-glycerol phosphate synthase/phosphoribosylanthranilate isomerase, partial [Candidatus Limnocylindrales bacterium]